MCIPILPSAAGLLPSSDPWQEGHWTPGTGHVPSLCCGQRHRGMPSPRRGRCGRYAEGRLADALGPRVTKRECGLVVDAFLDAVEEALARGDRIELRGFGTFKVRHRKARKARNPWTGEAVEVAARDVPGLPTIEASPQPSGPRLWRVRGVRALGGRSRAMVWPPGPRCGPRFPPAARRGVRARRPPSCGRPAHQRRSTSPSVAAADAPVQRAAAASSTCSRGRPPHASRVQFVGGDERQNPVRRPERRRASPADLAHQVRVADRLHAEGRRPQARAARSASGVENTPPGARGRPRDGYGSRPEGRAWGRLSRDGRPGRAPTPSRTTLVYLYRGRPDRRAIVLQAQRRRTGRIDE